MSVLKIQILAFPRRVFFGSQAEDESGRKRKILKRLVQGAMFLTCILRGIRTKNVGDLSQTL
jgi:hypothetical protein